MNFTPEIIQLIVVLTGLAGAMTAYIKLRTKIEKTASDARHRETQIKTAALAREAKLRSDAELIQQNAQKTLNGMIAPLQSQITTMQEKYDELQGNYTGLITEHATLVTSHEILEQSTKQALTIWKTKHTDAIAKVNAAGVKLTEAQKQFEDVQQKLQDSEQSRMSLLNTVTKLETRSALQDARILSLEEQIVILKQQMTLEQQLREKAEAALAAQAENSNNGKQDISVGPPDNVANQTKVSSEKVKHD